MLESSTGYMLGSCDILVTDSVLIDAGVASLLVAGVTSLPLLSVRDRGIKMDSSLDICRDEWSPQAPPYKVRRECQ